MLAVVSSANDDVVESSLSVYHQIRCQGVLRNVSARLACLPTPKRSAIAWILSGRNVPSVSMYAT